MEKLWLQILKHKSRPIFWLPAVFLWILSLIYRLILLLKAGFGGRMIRLHATVLSVGNITVGGAGKTPMVLEIARHLKTRGLKVGLVCSGYGRRGKKELVARSDDIARMNWDEVGDEALMLAEALPETFMAVSSSKSRAALLLEKQYRPDVIIVDDGFQHRRLHRDFDLLLIDANTNLEKESLFPFGRLREPRGAISRADFAIITKSNIAEGETLSPILRERLHRPQGIGRAAFINDSISNGAEEIPLISLSGVRIYFFAGVAGFDSLAEYLASRIPQIVRFRHFPDHCPYEKDHRKIINTDLIECQPGMMLTTYKDYVKVRSFDFGLPVYYLTLRLEFDAAGELLFDELERIARKNDGKTV